MPRSVSKGPFVDARLLGRIEQMNRGGEKKILKTWLETPFEGGRHERRVVKIEKNK